MYNCGDEAYTTGRGAARRAGRLEPGAKRESDALENQMKILRTGFLRSGKNVIHWSIWLRHQS